MQIEKISKAVTSALTLLENAVDTHGKGNEDKDSKTHPSLLLSAGIRGGRSSIRGLGLRWKTGR